MNLTEPVPVYLMYFTASPANEGVRYVADAYGRDTPALQHLASR
jgi:murein L,D-transpeptidase YcbB/YkuD